MVRNVMIAVTFLMVVGSTAGCVHRMRPGGATTVRGELAPGAECLMIVTKEGRRYSITGSPGSFKVGDRVCVRGRVVEVSICMAGDATISIEAIGPENDCP